MHNFKLEINLLPKGAWGNDFSKTLLKKDWDILRTKCYEKANYTCQICGYKTDELDAHEVWEFDVKNKTQTLKNIIALCSKCHGVNHFKNSERLGFGENAKRHFIKVNNCSELDFASHCMEAKIKFEERNSVYRWKILADLSKFGGVGIKIKQKYIPMIKNPYDNVNWENIKFHAKKSLFTLFENEESLGVPNVCSVTVDNYEGTIVVISLYANKIEWFLDDVLLKTKYNIAGKFKTEFKVADLQNKTLCFKLTGDGGTTTSKVFNLYVN